MKERVEDKKKEKEKEEEGHFGAKYRSFFIK